MSPSLVPPVTGTSSDSKVPSGSTTTCATSWVAARKRCTQCLCKNGFNLRLCRHYQHNCFALKSKTSASQHEMATCELWQVGSFSSRPLKKRVATLVYAADHPGPTHFVNLLRVWNSFAYASKIKSITCDTLMRSSIRVPPPMPFVSTHPANRSVQHPESPKPFLFPEGVSDTYQPMVAISNVVLQHLHWRRQHVSSLPSHANVPSLCGSSTVAVDRTWSSRETLVLTTREKAFVL